MLIDSPSNPTVKALRSLEQAKGRAKRRQFLVEGVRAVEDGLRSGHWPALCLYNHDLLVRTERGTRLLEELTHPIGDSNTQPLPIEASQRALEAVSGTQHPQGIVAAFPIIEWPEPRPMPGLVP